MKINKGHDLFLNNFGDNSVLNPCHQKILKINLVLNLSSKIIQDK